MSLDPVLVSLAEESEGADSRGREKLNGENGVHLADELVADVDSSLSHRAAKLRSKRQPNLRPPTSCHAVQGAFERGSCRGVLTLKSSGRLSSLLRGGPNKP